MDGCVYIHSTSTLIYYVKKYIYILDAINRMTALILFDNIMAILPTF